MLISTSKCEAKPRASEVRLRCRGGENPRIQVGAGQNPSGSGAKSKWDWGKIQVGAGKNPSGSGPKSKWERNSKSINLFRVLVHFESGEDCSSSLFGLLQAYALHRRSLRSRHPYALHM